MRPLAFVVLFFALSFGLSELYRATIDIYSLPARSEQQLNISSDSIDVLVVGDSHAKNGFDPASYPGSFNYAFYGDRYDKTFVRLRNALKQTPAVERVILSVGAHDFFREGGYPVEWMGWEEILRQDELGGSSLDAFRTFFLNSFFQFAGNTQDTWDAMRTEKAPMRRGYIPRYEGMDAAELRENALTLPETCTAESETNRRAIYYFERIVQLVEEDNLNLTIVDWPVSVPILEATAGCRKALDEIVARVISDHPRVEYVNWSNLHVGTDTLFADADHLNSFGAADLAGRLASRHGAIAVD